MPVTPSTIYQQGIDKQRILITGQGRSVIASLVRHVLDQYNRKYDFISNRPTDNFKLTEAPVLIVEASESPELLEYKHHIAILSHSDLKDGSKSALTRIMDATPKSGILIYAELDPEIKALATRERADVQAIPFKTYAHEIQNGKTILITSTQEKFPIALSGDANLQYVSAAKEVLKRIGITSGQFYRALSTFQIN